MPFDADAVAAVHRYSRGTPRVINTVCDNALFEAFLAKRDTVDGAIAERVASELGLIATVREAEAREARERAGLEAPLKVPEEKVDLAEIDRYLEGLKRA
jgi:hypothetical protein